MDDLINRQAAIEIARKECGEFRGIYGRIKDGVDALPSAQPEIIRCKDCKHWGKKGSCGKWDQYISNGDFYCGCAELKGEQP